MPSEASLFGGSHKYKQNKTIKLPCFIDRFQERKVSIIKYKNGVAQIKKLGS
jgi:hypothetical protein